jgi:formate dehydrogenase subunit gamma
MIDRIGLSIIDNYDLKMMGKLEMATDVKTDIQLDQIIAAHAGREGALLPILHDVQTAFGHVSEASIRAIAHALNLSRAEVHGVVSFYHDFHETPDPRPVLKLCRAEACQARGVEALAAALPQQNRVKVETVYCLGLCSVGPNAMVGDRLHARLDSARLNALVEQLP